MGTQRSIEYCLLEDEKSVFEFLQQNFHCSSSLIKKHFDKSFLSRSLRARSILKLPLNFTNHGDINPVFEGPEIPIIAEDDIFLVMDKPANLFVHPLVYDEQNNCLSFLRERRPELLNVNRGNYDRGLLYRLDFETSGVLIYVKNEKAHQELRSQFSTLIKKKIYLCRVEGHCQLEGEFIQYFSAREEKGKRVVVSAEREKGQEGRLHLESKQYDSISNTTLVQVELITGLRHQIRAQLAYLGYPLRGDEFYGGKRASRLFLHAYQYHLTYQGRDYKWTAKSYDFKGL